MWILDEHSHNKWNRAPISHSIIINHHEGSFYFPTKTHLANRSMSRKTAGGVLGCLVAGCQHNELCGFGLLPPLTMKPHQTWAIGEVFAKHWKTSALLSVFLSHPKAFIYIFISLQWSLPRSVGTKVLIFGFRLEVNVKVTSIWRTRCMVMLQNDERYLFYLQL